MDKVVKSFLASFGKRIPDWCCGIHTKWWWFELQLCKYISASYKQLARVSISCQWEFMCSSSVSCALSAVTLLNMEKLMNTKFYFKLGKMPTKSYEMLQVFMVMKP
jgi:hypothetical protein